MYNKFLIVIASSVWLLLAAFSAFPKDIFEGNISGILSVFVPNYHFVFFAFLIFADCAIAIFLLEDVRVKEKLISRFGLVSLFSAIFAMIIVVLALNMGQNLLTGGEWWLTLLLVVIYGWFRCTTYARDPIANPLREAAGADAEDNEDEIENEG